VAIDKLIGLDMIATRSRENDPDQSKEGTFDKDESPNKYGMNDY
jgi:hypothetical protein